MPKIAVNILTYNGSTAFIEKAIRSVLPYTDEIIVYDTGSTDDTLEVLKKYPVRVMAKDVQHLGKVWTNSKIDEALTAMLNEMKAETKAPWILKVDDDEVFLPDLMEEIKSLEPVSPIYSIPFMQLGKDTKLRLIKRLFQNIPEVSWVGRYGTETLAYKGKRVSSKKCPALKNYFAHLGGMRQDNDRKHNYNF